MSKKLIMRPNTVKVFHGSINNYFSLEECDIVKDSSIDRNCNTKEPGHHLKYASKTNVVELICPKGTLSERRLRYSLCVEKMNNL